MKNLSIQNFFMHCYTDLYLVPKLAIWHKITPFIFNLFFHIFHLLYNHFHIIAMGGGFFQLISMNLKWLWVIDQDDCSQKKTHMQSFWKHRVLSASPCLLLYLSCHNSPALPAGEEHITEVTQRSDSPRAGQHRTAEASGHGWPPRKHHFH